MESGSFDIGFMRLINRFLKNEFVSNVLPKAGSSGRFACGSVPMSQAVF
jgi:hypothetical protein